MMDRIEKGMETLASEVMGAVRATKAKFAGLTGAFTRFSRKGRKTNDVRAMPAQEHTRPASPRAKASRKAEPARAAKSKVVTMRAERPANHVASRKKQPSRRPGAKRAAKQA